MKYLPRYLGITAFVVVMTILLSRPAYAYIDPGSGSFILQMLLAAFFTFMFMLRRLRTKVGQFFGSYFEKKSSDAPEE